MSITALERLLEQAHQLRWNDYTQLIKVAEEALTIAREIDDVRSVVRSLNYLGWGYNRLVNCVKSIEPGQEAAQLALAHHLTEEYGYALLNLHVCYSYAGQRREGIQLVEELIALAEEHHYWELLAMALSDLGVYCAMSEDYELSLHYGKKGLAVIEEHQLTIPRGFFYMNLANSYLALQDISTGLHMMQVGLDDAKQTQFINAQIEILLVFSEYYMSLKDWDNALKYAQEALEAIGQIGSNPTDALAMVAAIYLKQGREEDALQTFIQARDASQKFDLMPLSNVNRSISDIYQQRRQYKKALQYQREAEDIRNRLDENEGRGRLAVLKVIYQLDTARRETELERQKNNALQAEMAERLKRQRAEISLEKNLEMTRVKTHILNRLSHEFRTPLTVLRASFDILTRYSDRLTPEQKAGHGDKIDNQFRHLQTLLDDILDVLRGLSQVRTPNPAPVDLQDLVASAIKLASERTHTADRIALTIHSGTRSVFSDHEVLEQVMLHLLTNAIRYSADTVTCMLEVQDQTLTITISDTGIGIPQDEQEAVFDVLVRGSNINEVGGNGIGLALVKHDVALLDGSIVLVSEVGRGTTVTVTIPLNAGKQA